MLNSLKEILGYELKATDGDIGKVKDSLFDDHKWVVRYLVVDTGNWLVDRLVIISPESLTDKKWMSKKLNTNLTKEKVENSPKLEENKPVSKQNENEINKYYGWPAYYGAMGLGASHATLPPPMIKSALQKKKSMEKNKENPNLRSADEVFGYNINTADGEIGHVEDFIADTETWEIMYMVIDTRDIFPGGKKVLCAIDWIEDIDFYQSKVKVDLTKDGVKNSPVFNPSEPVNRKYEERVYDYYGRPKYWV